MGAKNLAVVFAPSVLREPSLDPMAEMHNMKHTILVIQTMIERSDDVFVREAQPATQRIFVHKMPVSQLEEGEETFKLSKAKNVAR